MHIIIFWYLHVKLNKGWKYVLTDAIVYQVQIVGGYYAMDNIPLDKYIENVASKDSILLVHISTITFFDKLWLGWESI